MSSLDISCRLELPYNVGSTSREGRLHHVLGKTVMRRSYSRDALPRLPRPEEGLKMARYKAIYGSVDENELGRGKEKLAANSLRLTRGSKMTLTSVSCPERLGNVELHLHSRSQKIPSYKIQNKKSTMEVKSQRQSRLPSTGAPTMTREKGMGLASTSIGKLPSVMGEGHPNVREVKSEVLKDRSLRLGEQEGKENIKSNGSINRIGISRGELRKTLVTGKSSITKLNNGIEHNADEVASSENLTKPLPEKENLVRQRKIGRQEQTQVRPLSVLEDESEAELVALSPAQQNNQRKKSRKISNSRKSKTPDGPNSPQTMSNKSSVGSTAVPKVDWYKSRFTQRGQALHLFRKSVRKVFLVLGWFKSLSKKQDTSDETLKSFLDMAKDLEEFTNQQDIRERSGGLTFDPGLYSANKEIHLSEETKTILTSPSRGRNSDMIQKVVSVLQNLKAFSEYPLHMQQKFAKVAWFQEVPPKRIILKQGHHAENFYFILSGRAIVKQITKDTQSGDLAMRAVARMQNGQSFGEVALLHQTVRTATVESATNMHILLITREDFQRIFFNTLDGQDPEHIKFCRNQVSFLQGFPVDLCMEVPGTCLFHYFRPGAVVVSDSKENDWIYIVRSGSCKVLKKLDAVNPKRPWCEKKLDLRIKLPREGTAQPGPRIDTRLRLGPLDMEAYSHYARSDDDLSSYASDEFDQPDDIPVQDTAEETSRPECVNIGTTEKDAEPRVRVTRFMLPARPVTCGEPNGPAFPDDEYWDGKGDKKRKNAPKSAPGPTKTPHTQSEVPTKPGFSKSKLFFLPEIKKTYLKPVMPRSWATFDDDDDNITLADAMTIEARSTKSVKPAPRLSTAPTCFVQLRILRPRDAFGLEMIHFDDDKAYSRDRPNTSVTLVSNGCELIMLSRRFFERHATEASKKHIREKIRPFPTEETLQHNLQIEVNWDLYRKDTVGEFLDARRVCKDLKKTV